MSAVDSILKVSSKKGEQQWFIYSSPRMEEMAKKFGPVREIKRECFENGCPNVKIEGIQDLINCEGGAHVLFFHGYRNLHEKKMEEMIIFVLCDTVNVEKLIVFDPYDSYATMERITVEGVISSANTDAHFWKTLPVLPSG